MQRSALVVDEDEVHRRELAGALSRRGIRHLDVPEAFAAMAAFGRADFGAVIATEGRRTLSLRGLCQLARRRHPDIVIFVIHREGGDPSAIQQVLGMPVDILPPSASPDDVVEAVEAALRAGHDQLASFERLPTTNIARPLPSKDWQEEATTAVSLPAPVTAQAAPSVPTASPGPSVIARPLLEGSLEGGSGAALLMALFAQELTGRLILKDGPAVGTLYFYRGEPVWADDHAGDSGLHRRLVQKGKLPPDAQIEAVAAGQLLGALVDARLLTAAQMHEFMRELVRDCVLSVAAAGIGTYRFEEDRSFLDVAPLLRVNPFGLVLESRRKALSPAELMALSSEMAGKYVIPGPGLGASLDKLAPFVRGARLDQAIDGSKTVRQVFEQTNLDDLMGTLVMLALKETRLVSFDDQPRTAGAGGVTLNGSQLSKEESFELTVVDSDFNSDAIPSDEESKAREQILGLYMRLKPLTMPRVVLGVGIDANAAEIEAAFQSRMRELDPQRIPEGSAQQLLRGRVEELRWKVTSAYQVLKLQAVPAEGAIAVDPSKSNPF